MPIKYAVTLFAFAAATLALGVAAAQLAPEGANAVTAIMFPAIFAALIVACAVLSLAIKKNYKLGMIGIHLGLVLPLLIAAGSLARFPVSTAGTERYLEINEEIVRILDAEPEGADAPSPSALLSLDPQGNLTVRQQGAANVRTFERDEWKPAMRPKGYQAVSLFATGVLAIFAFVALIVQRPSVRKPADKRDEPAATE